LASPQASTPSPSDDTPKRTDGSIPKGAYDVAEVTDYSHAKIKAIKDKLSDDEKSELIELENAKEKPRKSVIKLLK
jgi:hypothetical protein